MTSFVLTNDLEGLIRLARLSLIARYGHEPERCTPEDDVVADFFPNEEPLNQELLEACLAKIAKADPEAGVLPGGPLTPNELEELQMMAHEYLWEQLIDNELVNFEELLAWCEAVYRTRKKLGGQGTPINMGEAVSSVLRYFWSDQVASRDVLRTLIDERPELLSTMVIGQQTEPRVALKLMIIRELNAMPSVQAIQEERADGHRSPYVYS